MKEMTSVAKTMMTEEEMTEVERQMNAGQSNGTTQGVTSTPHVDPGTEPTTGPTGSGEKSPIDGTESGSKERKKRQKLTPEQEKKLDEMETKRKKDKEERIKTLTKQLIERLRPFVDAKRPGEDDDPETILFRDRMKKEAEDLKLESFGVEVYLSFTRFGSQLTNICSQLLHTIGSVYMMKAISFQKSRKLLGM